MPVALATPPKKAFSWSYTKLKNYEACPRRHHEVDVLKRFKDEEGEALLWGNAVHAAFEKRLKYGTAFPRGMEEFEPIVRKVNDIADVFNGQIITEQQLAMTRNFAAAEWFGKDAWYRNKIDLMIKNGNRAAIFDWKTGKIIEDSVQLALAASTVFANHPDVETIYSRFIWLKDGTHTKETFKKGQLGQFWRGMWDRIEPLQNAWSSGSYPAKPGRLCRRWCPVTTCEHYGESFS